MFVGLFFGSFNPVHIGHLIIAHYIAEHTELENIWFVISPQNPLKDKNVLLPQRDRLHLVRLAIEDNYSFKASDIEFQLPLPSYTINTLTHLHEKYPQHRFALIMGSDNLESIHKWKNYEILLRDFEIFVYRRKEIDVEKWKDSPGVHILDVPLLDISSTFIRSIIKEKKSARYFLPDKVWEYIDTNNLYRKSF